MGDVIGSWSREAWYWFPDLYRKKDKRRARTSKMEATTFFICLFFLPYFPISFCNIGYLITFLRNVHGFWNIFHISGKNHTAIQPARDLYLLLLHPYCSLHIKPGGCRLDQFSFLSELFPAESGLPPDNSCIQHSPSICSESLKFPCFKGTILSLQPAPESE